MQQEQSRQQRPYHLAARVHVIDGLLLVSREPDSLEDDRDIAQHHGRHDAGNGVFVQRRGHHAVWL